MSTRAANRAITTYLLTTAGLDEPTVQIVVGVMKLDTPDRILAVNSQQLLTGEKIGVGDAVDILRIQNFLKSILKDAENPPSTLEEWRELITPPAFERLFSGRNMSELFDPEIKPGAYVSVTEKKTPTINIKVGDYPTFTGRHDDWYSFKAKFSALTRLHGNSEVIEFLTPPITHHY